MKVYLVELSGGVATILLGERELIAVRVPVESLQGFSKGELRLEMDRDPATRVEPQGRPKVDFEADGYRCRVVGSKLYRRPTHETFHEFIMRLLYWRLGTRWYDSEMKKPLDEQHEVVRW